MKKDPKYMDDEIIKAVKAAQDSSEEDSDKVEDGSKQPKMTVEQAKIAELTDDLKRVQAEFENYKKRADKECASFREYAKAELVKKLLAILDSFELALKNTDNHEEFVKGTELIYSQLYTLLKEEGLRPIETKDRKLDTAYHDVMLTEKSDKPEDTILEELQRGYMFKNGVLRHSKVKVAKK